MLMLHGDPGRGKTHLMVATLDALRSAGVGSAFWEVTELLAKLRGAVGTGTVEQEVREIAEIDGVLALDDIGPENKTGFGEENLYRIINRRWSHELPTIATCNSRLDDIDPRIRSRFKAGWTFLEKPGKDMRV
jgi:DNA replication protein DnaC